MAEYRQADNEGRIPLSYKEYTALRTIFGAVNALEQYHDVLHRRCEGIPHGWRDLRCLVRLSEILLEKILRTIPRKRLLALKTELDNTVCEVKVKGVTGERHDECIYVPTQSIVNLAQAATAVQCFGCQRTQEDARRHCQTYKDVQAILPYEFDECGRCPFAEG